MSNKTKALKKEIKKEENLVKKILETLSNGDVRAYRGNPLLKRQGEVIEFTAAHVKEYKRCAKDPVYFAERYIKIVHVDRGLIPIRLYDYQKKLIRMCHDERFLICLACRQSGKSTSTICFLLWYLLFNPSKSVALLANKGATSRMLLARIQLAYYNLPKWLQQGIVDWNKGSFSLENGSRIVAASTSSDSIRGDSFGCVTGDTKITILDDYDRIYYTDIKNADSSKYKYNKEFVHWENDYMFYTVYKITNLVNGKEYIGYHQTNDLEDGYMGSGKLIKRAIVKYGIENFSKEYINIFDNREDAEALEALLVNEEYTYREDTYNISLGGNVRIMMGKNNPMYGKTHSKELWEQIGKNISISNKGKALNRNLYVDDDIMIDGVRYNSFYKAGIELHLGTTQLIKKMIESGNGYVDIERQKILLLTIEEQELRKKENRVSHIENIKKATQNPERNKKISDALKGRKHTEEHTNKINKNPEKIKKTADKHRGMKRSVETCKNISNSLRGRQANNIGKIYCYNPVTLEKQLCNIEDMPEGWIRGFIPKELKNATSINA